MKYSILKQFTIIIVLFTVDTEKELVDSVDEVIHQQQQNRLLMGMNADLTNDKIQLRHTIDQLVHDKAQQAQTIDQLVQEKAQLLQERDELKNKVSIYDRQQLSYYGGNELLFPGTHFSGLGRFIRGPRATIKDAGSHYPQTKNMGIGVYEVCLEIS